MNSIALCGWPQVGKDVAAAQLVEAGYTRYAIGDELRTVAYALDPMVLTSRDGIPGHSCRLTQLVDVLGWEQAKKLPDVRRLLQRLGKEAGDDLFGSGYWADRMVERAHIYGTGLAVFVGVRLPGEVAKLRSIEVPIVRIDRPGVEAPQGLIDHPAEALDFPVDFVVLNDGTPEQLGARLLEIARG